MGGTFYLWFFWPNFAGKGMPTQSLPPANMLPTDSSCTLLGGLMVGLFLIPFMTPLLDDALQSVPRSLKEASLSLGANRWNTLKSVTIPYALPGIMNALLLGILTALGETLIVWFCIGLGARNLPQPLFDVLQRTSPLTSTIAGLLGGGSRATVVGPIGQSVASFGGLLLLIIAFAILALSFYLQGRIRKSMAR
jgi:ABC-type phosphate transport system permease subunit